MAEQNYSFNVEWYDAQAELVRPYLLYYFGNDNTLEMYDVRNRRTFLKRCKFPSVTLSDLFVGAQLTVYARQLKVVGYADETTKRELSQKQSRSLLIIKPGQSRATIDQKVGNLLNGIYKDGFTVSRLKSLLLDERQACEFFGDRQMTQRAADLTGGPVVAMEVVGADVANRLGYTMGNEGHISSDRDADMESKYLFSNPSLGSSAAEGQATTTVCVIKPHAVMAGDAGDIISRIIKAGFNVSAMEMYNMDKTAASEFMEVYKGVVPEYHALTDQLAAGPSIALQIVGGPDVVQQFREFCGPADPEVARQIRSSTLRAAFGKDKVCNGVHCTDLPEDGALESEFFFSILSSNRR